MLKFKRSDLIIFLILINPITKNDNKFITRIYFNKHKLWAIDYNRDHVKEVSEYNKREFLKNIIEYSYATIEDFLTKERELRVIHFHNTMNLPCIHMKKNGI